MDDETVTSRHHHARLHVEAGWVRLFALHPGNQRCRKIRARKMRQWVTPSDAGVQIDKVRLFSADKEIAIEDPTMPESFAD